MFVVRRSIASLTFFGVIFQVNADFPMGKDHELLSNWEIGHFRYIKIQLDSEA